MNYNIKINAEPANHIKVYEGSFEVDDGVYFYYVTDYNNGQIDVDFMDEEAVDEVLFDYEKKELAEKIKNEFKRI